MGVFPLRANNTVRFAVLRVLLAAKEQVRKEVMKKTKKTGTENRGRKTENRKSVRTVFHFRFAVFGFLFPVSSLFWFRLVRVRAMPDPPHSWRERGRALVVTDPMLLIRHANDRLVMLREGKSVAAIPLADVSHIALHGPITMTGAAVARVLDAGLDVTLHTSSGRLRGMLSSAQAKNVYLLLARQVRRFYRFLTHGVPYRGMLAPPAREKHIDGDAPSPSHGALA
jgi:hypothetical protein